MKSKDHLENITVPSKSVLAIVTDLDGTVRCFDLKNVRVSLRYIRDDISPTDYAYHPSNIESSGKFNSHDGDHLELVLATEGTVQLEVYDNDDLRKTYDLREFPDPEGPGGL